MFQIVVEILLVCLVLFGFLAAIFWFRKKPALPEWPKAGADRRTEREDEEA